MNPLSTQNLVPEAPSSSHSSTIFHEEKFFQELITQIKQEVVSEDRVVFYRALSDHKAQVLSMDFEFIKEPIIDPGKGVTSQVLRTKSPYYSNNLVRDPLYIKEIYPVGTYAELSVPLVVHNEILGAINLQSKSPKRVYNQNDIDKITKVLSRFHQQLINYQMYLSAKNLSHALVKKSIEADGWVKRSHAPYIVLKSFNAESCEIIGRSDTMLSFNKFVQRISPLDSNILIQGEAGIGKEFIARRIHLLSQRINNVLVVVNCQVLNDFSIDEGSLYLREALQCAHQGTLLLNNLNELKLDLQIKLLHYLESYESEVSSGSNLNDSQDKVKILASTLKDLSEEVQALRFSGQLYSFLNFVVLKVPSLSERGRDILDLANYFLNGNLKEGDEGYKVISDEVKKYLLNYHWPLNIRELKNLMKKLRVLCDHRIINTFHLPYELKGPASQNAHDAGRKIADFPIETLESLEKKHIRLVLEKLMGNKTQTAKALGITVKTLYNKLHAYNLLQAPDEGAHNSKGK